MSGLAWPLQSNRIRRDMINHTFGMVRNGGARAHQGWDLVAAPMTACYAVADGMIERTYFGGDYGKVLVLAFETSGGTLYAAYCHLAVLVAFPGDRVRRGDLVAFCGNSGNAYSMSGDDQHLHFEIRTKPKPAQGLAGRLDPVTLYGRVPIGWTYYESVSDKSAPSGLGLKVRGVNVRM